MRNFQRKTNWRDILQSKPALALLLILILIFAWNVFRFWGKMQETSRDKKAVEDKVTALKDQKEKLTSEIDSLNTEAGKEKFIRENYGFAKDGEGMIIITDDKNQPPAAPQESGGFFSFLKSLFK